MVFEKPPQLTGNNSSDLFKLRDYLFRMAGSLDQVVGSAVAEQNASVSYRKDGKQVLTPGGGGSGGSANSQTIQKIRQQANELRDLIIKTAKGVNIEIKNRVDGDNAILEGLEAEIAARVQQDGALQGSLSDETLSRINADNSLQNGIIAESRDRESAVAQIYSDLRDEVNGALAVAKGYADQIKSGVISYADQKVEEYNEIYVAKSEYGEFVEGITSTIETTARGVVESYNYASSIESVQNSIDLLQNYYTAIAGEIRRGIILDPSTGNYVMGIAISQKLLFTGQTTSDQDGNEYYYIVENPGQTFGLYTSTGWQFWINGVKVGWFDSKDGMLHVASVFVEERIIHGGYWEAKTELINSKRMYVLNYIGG